MSAPVCDTGMVLDALQRLSEPLTLLRVSLDLASDPMLSESAPEFLRDGLREADGVLRMVHMLREALETSLPRTDGETGPLDLSGAVRSVLSEQPQRDRERFRCEWRGSVPVLAAWNCLHAALAAAMNAVLRSAREGSVIDLGAAFEIEHVSLNFSFVCAGPPPSFQLFTREGKLGELALARGLAQSGGGSLNLAQTGEQMVLTMRLPLALLEVAGVQ